METLLILGDGSLIKGILVLPFAIYGLVLFIKGAIANIDETGTKNTLKKNWQVSAWFSIFILGYLAFIYAIARLL